MQRPHDQYNTISGGVSRVKF